MFDFTVWDSFWRELFYPSLSLCSENLENFIKFQGWNLMSWVILHSDPSLNAQKALIKVVHCTNVL